MRPPDTGLPAKGRAPHFLGIKRAGRGRQESVSQPVRKGEKTKKNSVKPPKGDHLVGPRMSLSLCFSLSAAPHQGWERRVECSRPRLVAAQEYRLG
jgi:hypothetical protein